MIISGIINKTTLRLLVKPMSLERKIRVDQPERCIRTRGLAAAMRALEDWGPHASLDRVAEIAQCPKASLARVFSSKDELFALALREFDRQAIDALRAEAARAGNGLQGAMAAAAFSARMAMKPEYRGCPLNAAGAHLASYPWAVPVVRAHRLAALDFYAELLLDDFGARESRVRAQAICLISDGVRITASAGTGLDCIEAAMAAFRSLMERR
jgi:AcrR family transcriptional regulator